MDKTYTIFNWLQKGFTNSFSLLPLLKELYEEVEKVSNADLQELNEKFPSIARVIEKLKVILNS